MATLTVVIFEDEPPGLEKMINHLRESKHEIEVLATFDSVAQGEDWFATNAVPDLILSDIQLTDGLVFSALENLKGKGSIIFTTAFDQYLLRAFDYHSIDYILKPITQEKVDGALDKFKSMKERYAPNLGDLTKLLSSDKGHTKRLIVRAGLAYKGIDVAQMAYAYSEHKVCFVLDREGERYMVDKNLQQLETELNPTHFFRANRQYLVALNSVSSFRSLEKGKLLLELQPRAKEEVTISQERAAAFKEWFGG